MGLDKWSVNPDHTGMTDHSAPDYSLQPTLELTEPGQYRALFEGTRLDIVDLLLERAATIKELSVTLEKPKGTIGHHVGVLEEAGLIQVVRTKMVRAIEAKYYGRTARTYLIGAGPETGVDIAPDHFLTTAAAEFVEVERHEDEIGSISTLRHARITEDRADEWVDRLSRLAEEFVSQTRGGETTYGLLLAMYPTARPHLPDGRSS